MNKGTVDVGTGDYVGTVSENSTPIILNPGTINVTYDNLNYQADATRANDLVLWYKFDETSGNTVKDSSGNGRDGTAMNTADSNWVPGVLGNAMKLAPLLVRPVMIRRGNMLIWVQIGRLVDR